MPFRQFTLVPGFLTRYMVCNSTDHAEVGEHKVAIVACRNAVYLMYLCCTNCTIVTKNVISRNVFSNPDFSTKMLNKGPDNIFNMMDFRLHYIIFNRSAFSNETTWPKLVNI